MKLEVIYLPIKDIYPDSQNTRTHSAAQVEQIAFSMLEFGIVNPVLITSSRQLIAGEGRWLGAQRANQIIQEGHPDFAGRHPGFMELPCIILDHLTDQQRRALVIADNRIALNSGWDWGKLQNEISDLVLGNFNVDVIGFSDAELEAMLADGSVFPDNSPKPPKLTPSPAKTDPEPSAVKGVSKIVHTCPNCGTTFN